VLLNSHGGQPQVMEIVCRELRVNLDMLAVGCFWPRLGEPPGLFDPEERRHGIHAGEVETSLMLHLHPDLVDMSKASDFVPLSKTLAKENRFLSPEGGISFGWQMQDLHPTGAAGNAAAADAARGAALLDHLARSFVGLVEEVARFPLERLSQPTVWRR
jgi:creatinine amidohydrolase